MTPQAELNQFTESAQNASQLLKAMSDCNRLMILCCLLDKELSDSELNAHVPLSQSALSQHLSKLKMADLVSTRTNTQAAYYNFKGDEALKIILRLKSIYCEDL
jgi:DNA-binding transcriptional ArsR family regulator